MKTDLDHMRLEAQGALDELFNERLIPFKLCAYKVESIGFGEYVVPFCDSRLHSIRFSWMDGQSLREIIRNAVLIRVRKMNGPLQMSVVGLAHGARAQ